MTPNPDKEITKQENYRPKFFMILYVKIFNTTKFNPAMYKKYIYSNQVEFIQDKQAQLNIKKSV